ncbi:ribonuclease H-like superfamily protein [Striga asiatica]|uniref:Ribonuclease H-like superfamily protein n=1 Tax=Striga asiatica TaxID=4170 RepID=A0A5A7PH83_STRAF|nr:ribonuclease H-like superfamily protein [Striga asiatica]
MRLCKVADLMKAGTHEWDTELVQQSFNPHDAALILNIQTSSMGITDTMVWHYNKEWKFTVKSSYQTIQQKRKECMDQEEGSSRSHQLKKMWKHTWKLPLKPKGMNVDGICGWCGEEIEDLEHIMFNYVRAKRVWKLAGLEWDRLQRERVHKARRIQGVWDADSALSTNGASDQRELMTATAWDNTGEIKKWEQGWTKVEIFIVDQGLKKKMDLKDGWESDIAMIADDIFVLLSLLDSWKLVDHD